MTADFIKPFDSSTLEGAKPIYGIPRGGDAPSGNDELAALMAANGFKGEAGALLSGQSGVLLGLGDGSDELVFAAAGDRLPAGTYYLADTLSQSDAQLAVFAWVLGGYRFDRYKSLSAPSAVLIAPQGVDIEAAQRAARATAFVRDLVNTPAADMTPAALADEAQNLSQEYDADIKIIEGAALLDQNFPMIHAVGRAAAVAPRLIDLRWGRSGAPKITLVGKGVCFDSGGLNIKGAGGMGLMKKDMGGAAHVLGLAQMVMSSGLDVNLRVLVPAVENSISANAFRPSDILKARNGLTVEIGNTDAEGRLVLADALALASEDKPDLLISMATLTGAARVAVGAELAPFYTDDENLAADLANQAKAQADPAWRMPLWKGYSSLLSSSVADTNNISSGGFAGSITAALFLQKFVDVGQDTGAAWAHFDIYAWRPKAAPGRAVGGEAQAMRALFAVLKERFG